MNSPEGAPEHASLPSNADCSPGPDPQIKLPPLSPQGAGEPGPAITSDSTDVPSQTAEQELEYFRSLPEEDLEALYPRGIRPPPNLGPSTPYDRYDQFHQALLHLAAGVSLQDVMRTGNFDIGGNQFVSHLAVFCAMSLGYTDQDLSRLGVQLLGRGYGDPQHEENLSRCSSTERISIGILPGNDEDTAEEGTCQQRQRCAVEEVHILDATGQSVESRGTGTSRSDPPNERVKKHKMSKFRMCALRVALSTFFRSVLAVCWKYAVPILVGWVLYETQVRPLFVPQNQLE
ncbi:hypothetical protein PV04_02294 [Phialophora macrospora]|uniref:Uncharacterized protein n=1 Tax=Phialophora macrospora TaxID=1851006 RepID=A0A0D2E6Q2_9EURO|nr:hypothetical protein PV04_02294 [Phialophora macrospora]